MMTKPNKRPFSTSLIRAPRRLVKLCKVFKEQIVSSYKFHNVTNCVAIFGSSRLADSHPATKMAYHTAKQLGLRGFSIITGGGPSIMKAGNRGARAAKAKSIACNIILENVKEPPNDYVDDRVNMFYFFNRKLTLARRACAFIAFPGGYGTLDEIFEIAVLKQHNKIDNLPIILVGSEFWQPMIAFIEQSLIEQNTISPHDKDLFVIFDTAEEVVEFISNHINPQVT